jgi:hypothetical protein
MDDNKDFPVGEWLPIPNGEKNPRPRERSRGSFFSHPRPYRRIYPRREPCGESVPVKSIISKDKFKLVVSINTNLTNMIENFKRHLL